MLSPDTIAAAELLLAAGASKQYAADLLQLSPVAIAHLSGDRLRRIDRGAPSTGCAAGRFDDLPEGEGPRPGDPTPEEIRIACEAFRRQSPRKPCGRGRAWRPPMMSARQLALC